MRLAISQTQGQFKIASYGGKTVKTWDVSSSGEEVTETSSTRTQSDVESLAFSPGGDLLAVAEGWNGAWIMTLENRIDI